MKLKRISISILIALIAVLGIFCFSGCDTNDGDHEHSFSEWSVSVEATCSAPGKQRRSCSCGYYEEVPIEQLSHSEVTDDAVPATCTTDGKSEGRHCSVCNHVIVNQEIIPALQHACDNVSIVETATCINSGTKRFSCTRDNCNYYYEETYLLQEYSSTEIYNQALNYVGEIITYKENGMPLAQGTGFVATADGRIITNYHVIEGAYSASITIGEDTYTIQSVLAFDADIDLAVLQINATGLTPANICKNDPVIAETVYAVGSPKGMTASVSVGIVSYNKRVIDGVTYVQHDAAITHGSSGSPLINKYGEVIGVNKGAYGGVLNVAVFTGELDNLVYGTPVTLAELYALEHTPNDILAEWLLGNYNYKSDDFYYYQVEGDGFIYAIGYDSTTESNFIEGLWNFADGSELYMSIYLDIADNGYYEYYAHYTLENNENYTHGYIDPATYSTETILTHFSYVGDYWEEDSLMLFYTSGAICIMEWFDYCCNNYILDITAEDFGFVALEYEYNSNALSELKRYLILHGEFSSYSEWYEIKQEYDYPTYDVDMSIIYNPATESVFAFMSWLGSDGAYYTAYLSLSESGLGNYYACHYKIWSGDSFVDQNDVWGYIDDGMFTTKTPLTYEAYNGLPAIEADLLKIYSSCLHDLLNWIGAFLDSTDMEIALADLGFVFYEGYTPIEDCEGENHVYLSPTFTWVEDENGFNVTATFPCSCGNSSQTATTYVPNTQYIVTKSADESLITYAFTASVVYNGYTYTDTRYIRYEWKTINIHNSNYKDYLSVGCGMGGYDVYTIASKRQNLTYSNVVLTFNVTVTGKYRIEGYDGLYNYHQTFRITHTDLSGAYQYTDIGTIVYSPSVTYSVSVTGQVSGYFQTDYLTSQ